MNTQSSDLKQVFLSTGTNLGDRRANLAIAKLLIIKQIGTVVKTSHVYETAAWGLQEQPSFLNQVLEVYTPLPPEAVLEQIQQIEQQMGRERRVKWGERIIDIDILFYEQAIIHTETLQVPHPFLHKRNFVLVPLQEIAPDFQHPVLKLSISQLLQFSEDILVVEILNE